MGRKTFDSIADDSIIGLPPIKVSGADYKLLVTTLKTVTDKKTGKPMKLGVWLERVMAKKVADIRMGKKLV